MSVSLNVLKGIRLKHIAVLDMERGQVLCGYLMLRVREMSRQLKSVETTAGDISSLGIFMMHLSTVCLLLVRFFDKIILIKFPFLDYLVASCVIVYCKLHNVIVIYVLWSDTFFLLFSKFQAYENCST